MTFISGEECALLPTGCKGRDDVETVTFMGFQLDSTKASAIGRMRYKSANGTHGKVEPQAVGDRVLFAQLLNLNQVSELAGASQPVAKRRKLEAANVESPVSSQEEGGAEDSSEEACQAGAAGGSHAGVSKDPGNLDRYLDGSAAGEDAAAAGKRVRTDKDRVRPVLRMSTATMFLLSCMHGHSSAQSLSCTPTGLGLGQLCGGGIHERAMVRKCL